MSTFGVGVSVIQNNFSNESNYKYDRYFNH